MSDSVQVDQCMTPICWRPAWVTLEWRLAETKVVTRHVSAVHPCLVLGMRKMPTLFGAFLLKGKPAFDARGWTGPTRLA